eukprot:s2311_g10.t1
MDMTHGEWDQLRDLLRRADSGGLMTVHRKERKNAPMNRQWPPDVQSDDEPPTGSGSAAGHDDVPSRSAEFNAAFVPPPGSFYPEEFAKQAEEFNRMAGGDPPTGPWKSPPVTPPEGLEPPVEEVRPREKMMHRTAHGGVTYQDKYPYDPKDDPWHTEGPLDPNPNAIRGERPVLTLYGKVQQQSAAAAKAAFAASQRAAAAMAQSATQNSSAGFPKSASASFPKSASASASEAHPPKASAAACGSERAQKDSQMPVEPKVTGAKSKAKAAGKIARISEEVEVVETAASPSASVESNATAMTDASKRRYDAMEAAVDRAYEDDEFSIVSETEFSPPSFPTYQAGLPDTFSWGPNWNDNEVLLNYDHVDDAIPKPAWIHSSEQWGRTLITMPKFAKEKISFHKFTLMCFARDPVACKYAKQLIGKFRKHVTACPRTQAPDLCAWLLHTRVDSFLDAGKTYHRVYEEEQ